MSKRTNHDRRPAFAAVLAATMALVVALFAAQAAGPRHGSLAGLVDRVAIAADPSSFDGNPLEFDPAAPGPRHAIQNRTHKLDPDGFADAGSTQHADFAIFAVRRVPAGNLLAGPVAAAATRHADARAPPASIFPSATL